jgi:hypothetical protein
VIPSACIPIYDGDRTTLVIRKKLEDVFVVVRTKNTKDGRWYQYRVYPSDDNMFSDYSGNPGRCVSNSYGIYVSHYKV